jgi:DnaK suppressor protein
VTPILDKAFIEQQRRKLIRLREALLLATQAGQKEEAGIRSQALGEAHEAEDDAQKLALLETDGNAVERSVERLARIERALRKIDDGSYGLSDASGKPIPRDRLEAMPDAIYTLAEVKALESSAGQSQK